jgi:hypothetical protein
MSAISLGIAGGVAQGSAQAREVSRALHRQQTDESADARRVRERLNAHLDALDEGDEANAISELHVDDQVPQRQPDQHEREGGAPRPPAAEVPAETPVAESKDEPAGDRLYRHLDVTG